ncbi:efflux RND transporter permease subunit [Psychrosphaera haliotis]|uniref:MMPL family transporter n=1 Tax=Psychrosphaera haliotis TaxID=555083 RepID=A0A6N8F4T1_9GAMM|nr:MMPL family transporter [Psychrosphaera haliotis]MUH71666.1 MMPL family transporter [Psychrosphaera haliotis]
MLIHSLETFLFRQRPLVILAFAFFTAVLGFQASNIHLDASFNKNIPLQHEYMQTYVQYSEEFGGANTVYISVCDKEGDIFNPEFFEALKGVHDQLFFIPGINRTLVNSLYSPSTRFIEVVEDGFAGGPVIPADFQADKQGLATVKQNVEKAGIVGRSVSDDYSCAMVSSQLLEKNPDTGESLDSIALANELEKQIREKFEDENISIHIIGFAKMIGDVATGAKDVVVFFAIAIAITSLMVWIFCRSLLLTVLPIVCSFMAVVWQLGMLNTLGFGLDPMSILVPFLVFAIGVSHGVQMINSIGKRVHEGMTAREASCASFVKLLIPGGIALLSDTVGFLTLLNIDIGIIRELAITASVGVAIIILTNLFLLPVLASYIDFDKQFKAQPEGTHDHIWRAMSSFTKPKVAYSILAVTALLYVFGYVKSQDMKIGDMQAGAPALHADSRYNQDTFLITDRYAISTDILKVIVETKESGCTYHSVMNQIDQFQWRLENVEGVQSAVSLSSVAKVVNTGFNEGNLKWRSLPRNTNSLVQSTARIETSTGLLNRDCSVMPIILFLEDHKAETIERIVNEVKAARDELQNDEVTFRLASGSAGVMAATNEAVSAAQVPMLWYVYGAVVVLCLLSFRSVKATVAVVLPLFVVSTLAQALMTYLEIGLTVSTMPVIALGVGIGVDYGIYILSTMVESLRNGSSLRTSYFNALKERGSAVLFTGLTLAIGVSTWVFSALKFQVDMGILLTFMFLVNMLGAIIVLPALASILWRDNNKES